MDPKYYFNRLRYYKNRANEEIEDLNEELNEHKEVLKTELGCSSKVEEELIEVKQDITQFAYMESKLTDLIRDINKVFNYYDE